MTNQTQIFSIMGIDAGTGIADVSDLVNHFIKSTQALGYSNYCIGQVVVNQGDATFTRNWYTVQVDYYDPSIY